MPFDTHKNLAIAPVVTAPSPAPSGTTLTIDPLNAARFPAPPFNATVWPPTELPTPVNAEVVRVTAIAGATVTITRAQEGTTARTIVPGDLIAATITAKTITDIESGTNFPLITTPGAVTTGGNVVLSTNGVLCRDTVDGADTGYFQINGGGGAGANRGAAIAIIGNEFPSSGGSMDISAGNTATGGINFYTGPGQQRGRMHPSGGMTWGGVVDPGAGTFAVTNSTISVGQGHVWLTAGGLMQSGLSAASGTHVALVTASGLAGSITSSGTTTTYNTTSDARLKTDRGRHTDPDVLRHTVIHDFVWTSDGTPGRGVFAQEAVTVAPFAVSVGGDEVDDQGRLTTPWGVDYSKYVPDLITGWQDHDAKIDQLLEALEANVALVERLTAVARRPSVYQRMRTWIAALWPAWITS